MAEVEEQETIRIIASPYWGLYHKETGTYIFIQKGKARGEHVAEVLAALASDIGNDSVRPEWAAGHVAGLELPDRGSFMAACTSDDVEDPDGGSDMDENLDILDDRTALTLGCIRGLKKARDQKVAIEGVPKDQLGS
jgi:hypothetical protein